MDGPVKIPKIWDFRTVQNLLKQKSPVTGIKRASLDGLERLQTEYYRPENFFTSVPSQISVKIFRENSMPLTKTLYIVQ